VRTDQSVGKAIKVRGYFLNVLCEFQRARGEQEDALEFLEFFLDHLHEEYEATGKIFPDACEKHAEQKFHSHNKVASVVSRVDDGWTEVQKNGKIAAFHHNQVDAVRSPINWLFKGSLRSEIKHVRDQSLVQYFFA